MLDNAAAEIIGAVLRLFSLYFLIIFIFAVKKPKTYARAAPRHKFAVLLPARNEAAVIARTVKTLKEQDYPDRLYDIYVIPNNCTDGTAEEARRAGAKVFDCVRPVSSKGGALHEAVSVLLKSPYDYDVFCVFDADNEADPGFLAEMNRAFCSGVRVAKGRTEARNPYDSWTSGCYSIYFDTFNLLYNRGRAALGLSAKLIGTAFAVHRSVLAKKGGFGTETIAEDAEFAANLAIEGERVAWVPQAAAYDEEPLSFGLSFRQRRRWCSGILEVSKKKLPELARAVPRKSGKRMLKIDSIMFLMTPIVQSAALLPPVIGLIGALAEGTASSFLAETAVTAAAAYVCAAVYAAVIARAAGRYDRRIIRSVLTFPLFMASFFPLQLLALVKKTTKWEIIPHGLLKDLAKSRLAASGKHRPLNRSPSP